MKTVFLFTIQFSATLIHPAPLDEEKIIGGSEVQGNDFPWEVSLGDFEDAPSTVEECMKIPVATKLENKSATGELACLTKEDPTTPYPSPLIAIGWGNTQPMVIDLPTNKWSGISPPRKLKQAKMDDVSAKSSICKGRPDLLCIQGISAGDGSCKGDSGGSSVSSDNRVVAITSFGGSKPVPRAYQKYQTCNGDAAYT
ncbi:hypothetical protein BC941DRAFT_476759 [Chlamydoabsidia padenii]|nr:hypothetical protein BC941DRAFT_476759 [Chlamydoabsidia padenii]